MANLFKFSKKKKQIPENTLRPTDKEKLTRFSILDIGKYRTSVDIDDYLNAIEAAINPISQNRLTLYNFYERTLLYDTFTKGLIDKRVDNITNKNLVPYIGDTKYEELNDFIQNPIFIKFIKDILLDGKFYGMGLYEFSNNKNEFNYFKFDAKHINPFTKEVLESPFDSEGQSWEKYKDILFIGDENELGYLLNITFLSLYKRAAQFNYAKYVDLASENFMKLMVKDYGDEENLQKVQQQLNDRAGGGVLQVPDNWNTEVVNNSSVSQNNLFENYMQMLKDELTIYILGQTMTTQDGSSKSQSEVHQDEQEDKYTSDEEFICHNLNFNFNKILPLWGFNEDVTWVFEPTNESLIRKDLVNYERLRDLGIQFTDEELREKFKTII